MYSYYSLSLGTFLCNIVMIFMINTLRPETFEKYLGLYRSLQQAVLLIFQIPLSLEINW
uniref:Uncharacterized protein n=1 Tax=Arundo donax TaxID=35708 RepID=A0A0A9DPS3_ARUDO